MRHKPQQARSERMVQTIHQAALQVLAENGAQKATTRHIADRAGISVGTLYHYYANKNEIIQALEQQFVDMLVGDLRAITPSLVRKDFGAAIRSIAQLYQQSLSRDNGAWSSLVRHLLRHGIAHVPAIEQPLAEFAMQYLNAHPELAQVRDFPKVNYILLNACAFNLVRHAEKPPVHISSAELVEGLVDMAVAYVESQRPNAGQAD